MFSSIRCRVYLPISVNEFPYPNRLGDTAVSPSVLLVSGACADAWVAPALLAAMEPRCVRTLSAAALHTALAFTQEQALISVLYPRSDKLETIGQVFMS